MASSGIRPQVRIEGAREVKAELEELDEGLGRALKDAYTRVANEVADASQLRALSEGGVAAFVAPSIRTSPSVNAAAIRLGVGSLTRKNGTIVAAAKVAPGAEFGSQKYRQFRAWRGKGADAGYFVYPTIRDNRTEIAESAAYEFEQLIKRVAPL